MEHVKKIGAVVEENCVHSVCMPNPMTTVKMATLLNFDMLVRLAAWQDKSCYQMQYQFLVKIVKHFICIHFNGSNLRSVRTIEIEKGSTTLLWGTHSTTDMDSHMVCIGWTLLEGMYIRDFRKARKHMNFTYFERIHVEK